MTFDAAALETLSVAATGTRPQISKDARSTALYAAASLQSKQYPEGYWVGDLTADSTLQSDYILLQMWLYPPDANGRWNPPTLPRIRKAVRAILEAQRADGGWNIYEPGPSEINATVRAYTMLKMTGIDIESQNMRKARELILKLGGIQA